MWLPKGGELKFDHRAGCLLDYLFIMNWKAPFTYEAKEAENRASEEQDLEDKFKAAMDGHQKINE